MGAMLAASVLLAGSTASADEASRPLGEEQAASVTNRDHHADARDILPKAEQASLDFDAYIDARDIPNSGTGLNFSNKLVSITRVH